jgi:glycine/D-amino acid oxidase-like deaminating enzyme
MHLKAGYPFSLIRYGLPYHYPKLTRSVKTDVAIIGGGISGALSAYCLVNAGIDCLIVDGRTVGLGSTCASTSLLQYEIDVSLGELTKKIGYREAVRSYTLCSQSIDTLSIIAKKVGFREFDFRKSLYFAAHKKDTHFLREEYALRKKNGFKVAYLEEEDIQKKFGFAAPGAILSHQGAQADAYLFTHALHQYSIKHGLSIYDRTFIKHIRRHKRGVTLKTEEGFTIDARKVICATGYEATAFFRKKIVKLQSTYATMSESIPGNVEMPKNEPLLWNTGTPYLYLRHTADNRIVIGGRDEPFYNPSRRDKLIQKKATLLMRDFKRLFPDIPFKREFSWAGTFGSTVDGLPFIGAHPRLEHTYFALGFGGNGITFSLIAAEMLTDLFLGKKNPDLEIFSFNRV